MLWKFLHEKENMKNWHKTMSKEFTILVAKKQNSFNFYPVKEKRFNKQS